MSFSEDEEIKVWSENHLSSTQRPSSCLVLKCESYDDGFKNVQIKKIIFQFLSLA